MVAPLKIMALVASLSCFFVFLIPVKTIGKTIIEIIVSKRMTPINSINVKPLYLFMKPPTIYSLTCKLFNYNILMRI